MRQRQLYPIAVTVAELADSIGVDSALIYTAIKLRRLPVFRVGVRRLILVEDAVSWLRENFKREY